MWYDMTFGQLLTFIETRSERERRINEEVERRIEYSKKGLPPPPPRNKSPEIPKVSELQKVFGGL